MQDSASKISSISAMVSSGQDYAELDQVVHQFKGSTASLGAAALTQLCAQVRLAPSSAPRAVCDGTAH